MFQANAEEKNETHVMFKTFFFSCTLFEIINEIDTMSTFPTFHVYAVGLRSNRYLVTARQATEERVVTR
jgi:hypothetical protein